MKEWNILKPHMIHENIGMKVLNQYIKRKRYVQSSTIKDFTYHLQRCKIFSNMDLKARYHQLMIYKKKTRKLTTFSTLWENYRKKCNIWSEVITRCVWLSVVLYVRRYTSLHESKRTLQREENIENTIEH